MQLDIWLQQTALGNRTDVAFKDSYSTLGSYRFQLCPTGAGIQAPKVQESWSTNTIPITQKNRAFEELAEWGYPIAIVDEWSDISPLSQNGNVVEITLTTLGARKMDAPP
jgi:hypothetical protein